MTRHHESQFGPSVLTLYARYNAAAEAEGRPMVIYPVFMDRGWERECDEREALAARNPMGIIKGQIPRHAQWLWWVIRPHLRAALSWASLVLLIAVTWWAIYRSVKGI